MNSLGIDGWKKKEKRGAEWSGGRKKGGGLYPEPKTGARTILSLTTNKTSAAIERTEAEKWAGRERLTR